MPRIRTIKPEFWTSEQIVECSPNSRLLFIGMWNFCDDGGVHPDNAMRLKMEIFPGDPLTKDEIEEMLEDLESAGLLRRYEVDGKRYLRVTGWKHQRIDQPTYRHPQPDGEIPGIPSRRRPEQDSDSVRRTDSEQSANASGVFTPGSGSGSGSGSGHGSGKETTVPRKRGEPRATKKKTKKKTAVKKVVARPSGIDPQVWEDWKRARGNQAPLTPTAWSRIEPELAAGVEKGYLANDMLATAAVKNWRGFKLEWYENQKRRESDGGGQAPAARVWDELLVTITRGRSDRVAWMDKQNQSVKDALQDVGGLQQLGLMNEFQLKAARERFLESLERKWRKCA